MAEFTIKPAVRKAIPLLLGLYGLSGGGKTLSALKIARGLVGPGGKIGLIDTENGRGSMYADDPEIGGYLVIEMAEPFAPPRFAEAVKALESAGCGAIIVDSFSHEWEGPGGVLAIVDQAESRGKPGLHNWKRPKQMHKAMLQRLLRSPAHIVFCMRGKPELIQTKVGGKTEITRGEVIPIQEANLIFEMTVHLRMTGDGLYQATKCPAPLKSVFNVHPQTGVGGPLSVAMGAKVAAWIGGGSSAGDRRLAADAQEAANLGARALEAHLSGLTADQRRELAPELAGLKASAAAVDAEAEAGGRDEEPFDPGASPAMSATEEAAVLEEGLIGELGFTAPGGVRDWWRERAASLNRLKLMDAAAHQRVVDAASARSKEPN